MADEKNEFSDLDVESDVPETFNSGQGDSMVSSGSMGTTYDWSTAPERSKAPPRIDLNGKTITVLKAEIVLPSVDTPWEKSRDKTKDMKPCTFVLFYDVEGQQEFYSGVNVFKKEDKYSHPTIYGQGTNQAAVLLQTYAKFKGKNPSEVSLREFMGFLNSKPKAVIKAVETKNPRTMAMIKKNLIDKFI